MRSVQAREEAYVGQMTYHLLKGQGIFLFVAKRIDMSEACQHQIRAHQHGRRWHHQQILSTHYRILSALNDDRQFDDDHVDEGCRCTGETRHNAVEELSDDIHLGTSLCESMFRVYLEGRWIH